MKEEIKDLEIIDLDQEDDLVNMEDIDELEDLEELDDAEDVEDTDDTSEETKDKANNIKKEIFSWVMTFAVAFVTAFLLKNYVIINAYVPTGSMENTIQGQSSLFGYRLAYLNEEPQRGDIIFFYYPDDESQKFVKRIIGLPGEVVTIVDGKIYIDGAETPLDEPYLKEEWVRGTGPYEFVIPADCYFVLGDNRNSSHDARYWVNTYVTRDKIIGKALYVYYPFDQMGPVE